MKKLLTLLIVLPLALLGQKKNNGFAYLAPGFFAGKGSTNLFFPSIGLGYKSKKASLGVAAYYSKKYNLSLNADFRMFLSETKKPGPFIFLQPGISLYRGGFGGVRQKGGFDFKAGAGFMTVKSPGIYFSLGYHSFRINTTAGTKHPSIQGAFVLLGLRI